MLTVQHGFSIYTKQKKTRKRDFLLSHVTYNSVSIYITTAKTDTIPKKSKKY